MATSCCWNLSVTERNVMLKFKWARISPDTNCGFIFSHRWMFLYLWAPLLNEPEHVNLSHLDVWTWAVIYQTHIRLTSWSVLLHQPDWQGQFVSSVGRRVLSSVSVDRFTSRHPDTHTQNWALADVCPLAACSDAPHTPDAAWSWRTWRHDGCWRIEQHADCFVSVKRNTSK